eukprot:m.16257 g.16257  ORF g.16257 m.16257 type:complete len:335 (-) comp5642_c0_seq2:890-1894(-)
MATDEITPMQRMASSSIGAVLTSMIVTPFDVVKTRLQAQEVGALNKPKLCDRCYLFCNGLMDHLTIERGNNMAAAIQVEESTPARRLTGTIDAFGKIIQHEGLGSLWRGLPPTLAMAVPATVIYFTSYDYLKAWLGEKEPYAPLLAGSVARVGAVTVISPLEMVRTKMQARGAASGVQDVSAAVASAIRQEGVLTLWRGLSATLLRDVPFSAIYWFGYERLKNVNSTKLSPFWGSFVAGAVSGSIAATVTLPFDVVKTRIQIDLGTSMCKLSPPHPAPSTSSMMKQILHQSGPSGLFVGLIPRIAKVAPSCAIMISSYEFCKDYFRNNKETLFS